MQKLQSDEACCMSCHADDRMFSGVVINPEHVVLPYDARLLRLLVVV